MYILLQAWYVICSIKETPLCVKISRLKVTLLCLCFFSYTFPTLVSRATNSQNSMILWAWKMEQHEQNLSYRILQSSKLFFFFCFLFYLMIIIVFLSFQFFVCLKDLNCKISLKCPYSQSYDKNHASNFYFYFFSFPVLTIFQKHV